MGTNDWQLNWRPTTPDYSEKLGGLAQSLGDLAEFRRKQRSDSEYARQNKLAEDRLKMQDLIQRRKDAQGDADRNAKVGGEILDEFRRGGGTAARARARLSKFTDPNGVEHGFDFDPGGETMDIGETPKLAPPSLSSAARGAKRIFGGALNLRQPGASQGPADASPDDEGAATPSDLSPGQQAPGPLASGPAVAAKLLGGPKLQAPGLDDMSQRIGTGEPPKMKTRAPAIVMPTGERIDVDPLERERFQQAQNEEKAARIEGMLASGQPLPPVLRAQMTAQLTAIRGGLNGQQSAAVSNAAAQDSSQEFKRTEADKHDLTAEQRFRIGMRPRSSGLAGLANRPMTPAQKADDERAAATAWGTAYSKWEKNANVDKLTDGMSKFVDMRNGIDAYRNGGDVISMRGAMYNAARLITGPGVLTQQEFDNTVQSTSGILASALTKVRKNLDGTLSEPEAQAIENFVTNQSAAIKLVAAAKVRNFDKRFQGGYYAKAAPDEVLSERAALLDRFGLTDEEMPLQQVTPASGQGRARPPAPGGRQAPPAGAPGAAPAAPAAKTPDPRIAAAEAWLASPAAAKDPKKAADVRAKVAAMKGVR